MTLSGKNTYAVVICKMATVGDDCDDCDDCSHIIQDKLVISMNLLDSLEFKKHFNDQISSS